MPGEMAQDIENVDDVALAQVEQVLALAAEAGAPSLPAANVCQRLFDGHPLARLRPACWRLLSLAQLGQEPLIGVDAHTASVRTSGTALAERTSGTSGSREVDGPTRCEGQLHLGRTAGGRAWACAVLNDNDTAGNGMIGTLLKDVVA